MGDKCKTCRPTAPSQSATLPQPLPVTDYPFHMVSSDYFELKGHHYLVMACRYSVWSTIYKTKDNTSTELISRHREHMVTFGVMDELATDGRTVYTSAKTQEFHRRFGIRHRVASEYNPHSNQMAEGAVKAAKRMLRDNTGEFGTLDTDLTLPFKKPPGAKSSNPLGLSEQLKLHRVIER